MRILLALCALLALAASATAQGCGPGNPNCIVPTAPVGTNNNQAASTAFVQTAIGGFTGFANPTASVGLTVVNGIATTAMRSDAAPPLSQAIIPSWTNRHIWALTPTYDQASGVLGTGIFIPLDAASHTVGAGLQFNHIAVRQSGGGYNQFTLGANSIVEGIGVFLQALSGSDVSSNLYGAVFDLQNSGPGNTKSVHASATAIGTSSGVTVVGSFGLTPVATSNTGSVAVDAVLVSNTGIHDIGTGVSIRSTGDRLLYGVGNTIAAVPIGNAFYQAWMATGSSTNARAFQVRDNAGNELGYISKTGTFFSGLAGTQVGGIGFANATSGSITVQPTTGALGSSVLTLPALTGTVATTSVAGGGTGAATFTANGVLYGNGTGALQVTPQGAANSILTANAGAPVFSATPTIGGVTKITSNVTSVAADANTMLQIIAPDAQTVTEIEVRNYGGQGPTIRGYTAGGTAASPSLVGPGTSLWNLAAFAYGTSFLSTPDARMTMVAAEVFSGTAHGTYFTFSTTPTTTVTIAEAMRIQASGGISVGTTTDPGIGAILANTSIKATTTLTVAGMANVATTSAVCYNTGTGLLTYDGTIGTCTVSDERLKNMGPRIGGALDKLLQINGVYYTWRDAAMGAGRQIGLGAQTVERVFPELVQTDSKGTKGLDYARLTAPIIEALRELKADNDNLRAEVKTIKRRTAR